MPGPTLDSYIGGGYAAILEAEFAKGPSRPQNPRPPRQSDEYRLGEMLPQSVLDAEADKARLDREKIDKEKAAMIRSGAATVVVKGAIASGTRGTFAKDADWSK